MPSDVMSNTDNARASSPDSVKLALKPLFRNARCGNRAPHYNMADFAKALNWITQEIMPAHRWVLDPAADCFSNIRLNLVGVRYDEQFNRYATDARDTVTPAVKDALVNVFRQYMSVAEGAGEALNPDPAVPMRVNIAAFTGIPEGYAVSAEVIAPRGFCPQQGASIPVLSRLIRPLAARFNGRVVVEELKAQGFGDLSGLSREELMEFRRAAYGLYPLNQLNVHASGMRDRFWQEVQDGLTKKDRDEEPGLIP